MESFESDMILDVQKKIAKEITLVVSERTREGRGLPTGENCKTTKIISLQGLLRTEQYV